MTYRKDTKTMLYRSKMNPNLKRNFALFPVPVWIAEITAPSLIKGSNWSATMASTVTSQGEEGRNLSE